MRIAVAVVFAFLLTASPAMANVPIYVEKAPDWYVGFHNVVIPSDCADVDWNLVEEAALAVRILGAAVLLTLRILGQRLHDYEPATLVRIWHRCQLDRRGHGLIGSSPKFSQS